MTTALPDSTAEALLALAGQALARSDWDHAEAVLLQAQAAAPARAQPLVGLARVARARGRHAMAQSLLREALAREPDNADALNNLGQVLRARGDRDEAIALLLRAHHVRPNDPVIFINLSQVLNASARGLEAAALARAWIEAQPDHVLGWVALSEALNGASRFAGAVLAAKRALAITPGNPSAQIALAQALRGEGRFAEAAATARLAFAQRSHDRKARLCVSFCLASAGAVDEALAIALLTRSETPGWEADIAVMRAAFFAGRYDLAWQAAEARHQNDVPLPRVPVKRWQGEAIAGKTIVLVGEQGLGDSIQFARYAWALADAGARVLLHVQSQLAPLFSRTPHAIRFVESFNARAVDYWSPLLSTPHYLNQAAPMAPPARYVTAPQPAALPETLLQPGVKAGLVWAGNPEHKGDHLRSLPLAALAPILETGAASFYALQLGAARADIETLGVAGLVHDLGDALSDWGRTAHIIEALDVIITVDTAVAHLAGALGKPVWMLTPICPDWRWRYHGATTPWYPSMRLYRQQHERDWRAPILAIARDLLVFAQQRAYTARSA